MLGTYRSLPAIQSNLPSSMWLVSGDWEWQDGLSSGLFRKQGTNSIKSWLCRGQSCPVLCCWWGPTDIISSPLKSALSRDRHPDACWDAEDLGTPSQHPHPTPPSSVQGGPSTQVLSLVKPRDYTDLFQGFLAMPGRLNPAFPVDLDIANGHTLSPQCHSGGLLVSFQVRPKPLSAVCSGITCYPFLWSIFLAKF